MHTMITALRSLFIAIIVSALALVVGIVTAGLLCSDGGCASARGLTEILGYDGRPLSIEKTALELGAALFALGLFITLIPRETPKILASIFSLLLIGDGFLMALAPPEPDPEPAEVPAPRVLPAPVGEPEACPDGEFRQDDVCVPCFVEVQRAVAPDVTAIPVLTDAYWVYASERQVHRDDTNIAPIDMVEELDAAVGLCDAPAIVVFGSASSDGERQRNRLRAKTRGENLAEAAEAVCGNDLETYVVSIGQSRHEDDLDEDRPVSIVQIFPAQGDDLTEEMILREIGHKLAEDADAVPLLAHRDRFPGPWVLGNGEPVSIDVAPRPMRSQRVLAPGAPESCTKPVDQQAWGEAASAGDEGLDERAAL